MLFSQAIQIGKSYGASQVFSNINLEVRQGDRIGIVGPNGAGKTTFFRIFCGLLESDQGQLAHGSGIRIGYLEQFQNWSPTATIQQILEEAFEECKKLELKKSELELKMGQATPSEQASLMNDYGKVEHRYEHLGGYEQEYRMQKISQGLGFGPESWEQTAALLSGGEKTRLALARLLLSEPDLLFLDEPTNHLDITMLEWLEEFLLSFSGAILVISHDRSFLDRVTTSTFAFLNGKAKLYPAGYSHYLKILENEQESQMRAYEKQQFQIAKTESFIDKYRAGIKSKQARGRQSILSRLEKLSPPEIEAQLGEIIFAPKVPGNDPMLTLEDFSVGYPTHSPLLTPISLVVRRGQGIALMGPNGTGKTTLVKSILGTIEPLGGTTRFGKNTHIGYFSQHQEGLNPNGTVLDELLNDSGMTENRARKLLGRFLFPGDDVFKVVSSLSGGERARLSLLKLLLSGSNFLVLDEPTNHLDIASQETIEKGLSSYSGTFLVISHDRYFIDQIADHLWILEDGNLIQFSGNYSDYEAFKKRPIPPPLREQSKESSKPELSSISIPKQKAISNVDRRKSAQQLRELENKITELEQEKMVYDIQFKATNFWERPEAPQLAIEYETLQNKLSQVMDEWEELSLILEE